MNPLITLCRKFGPISFDIEKELDFKTQIKVYEKDTFFIKEGQIVSSLFVIEKGLVRSFYMKEDREIIDWFGFENIPLGATMPLFFNRPSLQNIQFLETSTIHYISNSDLNTLYNKYNEMNTIGRRMTEEFCRIMEERSWSLQTESAEQRYLNLIKSEPEILQRVSLRHIASYLGITQETLSRIRSKRI
ncbi:MAG: Crp/Fnr family transcriptional regulator [Parachlamydiaceae bacterium]